MGPILKGQDLGAQLCWLRLRPAKQKKENLMADIKITVNPNGPLLVKGNVDLVDKAGNAFPHSEKGFTLCRCGQSSNKPFCDGSHGRTAFNADTKAPAPVGPSVTPVP